LAANGSIAGSADKTVFGATLGAGVEYAFMPGWSAKIEYDYYDFGSQSVNVPITASGGITAPVVAGPAAIIIRTPVSVTEQVHTVRAGVKLPLQLTGSRETLTQLIISKLKAPASSGAFFANEIGPLVCCGSKAPFQVSASHCRSTPNNGHRRTGPVGPVRANNRKRVRAVFATVPETG